jgi:hypothetical protein
MIFWNNILKYIKFFISSVTGLGLVILFPIIQIFKTNSNKIKAIIIIFLIFLIVFLIKILRKMLDLE